MSSTPEMISTCDPFLDAAIGMAFVTVDGRFLRVNPALCDLLGRDGDTLLASTWSELTHPDDLQASGDQIPAMLSGQRPRIDFRVGAVDGQIRVLLVRTYRSESQPANPAIAMDEEVLRRLRADPRTSATPVVVLSADATSGQVQRLRANGATDYLTKPFDIAGLLAVIDSTGLAEQPTDVPEMPPASLIPPGTTR